MQRLRPIVAAVAGVAACVSIAVLPLYAQTPVVPQQAPSGTTQVSAGDPMILRPGADGVEPMSGEVTSVTSSNPGVVSVDANYSNLTGNWTLNYQCKEPGVAVVTVVLKSGAKFFRLVGCGVSFPLQTVDYTKGHYNSHSYMAWVDQKGTLVVTGLYNDANGNAQSMNISVQGYAPAKPAPPKVPATPPPAKGVPEKEGGGD